jgi:hypothetical protein
MRGRGSVPKTGGFPGGPAFGIKGREEGFFLFRPFSFFNHEPEFLPSAGDGPEDSASEPVILIRDGLPYVVPATRAEGPEDEFSRLVRTVLGGDLRHDGDAC